eukprot:Blabericola_migrator_1__3947@NODE_219_length_11213_cov_124_951821_g186_i0_p2_GENE_NODE_219_length_11213_cov_124_951821_g186_i0NODE_219_length_11213_cov_124_951821_g186_i0_p2_ORF_typecomplete_len509_score55_10MFS_1/PF07690_16/1_9e12MFS_1/PF07690_16/4_7e09MFS_2/PF13347_6/6_3e18MFS_2/PF13347_6/4_5e02ATG22/PF11700_8/1_2e10MFS_1_like/PF12832_7/5_3e06TRI12/PF06609_13/7_6e02TRI12/PF06609_13/0_0031TRI12/PF06609_13/9_9e02BT1/PF03092_16/0_026BT1/PF03092_16/9_7e02BT1/PF03092_16/5_3e02BT1/PF03092_16/1_5e02_
MDSALDEGRQAIMAAQSFEIMAAAKAFDPPQVQKEGPSFRGGQAVQEFPPGYYISRSELVRLLFFQYPYGLVCGTMALCILPAEAARLAPLYQSYLLGFFLGVVGLSQLVCPLVGKISDKYPAPSAFSQRMPFFAFGATLTGVSVLVMWFASAHYSVSAYSLALLLGMCGLNICTSIQTGLLPSFVDSSRSGEASGVSALGTLLGSSTGFGIMAICNAWDFHFVYPLYTFLMIVALVVTRDATATLDRRLHLATRADLEEEVNLVVTGTEEMLLSYTKLASSLDLHSLLLSYHLPLTEETRDFFWVFIGRTCYYVAVSVQAFILYYLRDVVNTSSEAQRMTQVGIMALTAQCCAAAIAYPLGRTIDNIGVSRKLLIYLACFVMSLCYAMLAGAPAFGGNAFYFVWFAAVVYGIGNGCFLSVDYSIALTTLPDKSQAAQSLGIWGLSAFVGSAIGPLLWGFAVQVLGSTGNSDGTEATYSYWGYFLMLVGGILATFFSALSIATLRSVR